MESSARHPLAGLLQPGDPSPSLRSADAAPLLSDPAPGPDARPNVRTDGPDGGSSPRGASLPRRPQRDRRVPHAQIAQEQAAARANAAVRAWGQELVRRAEARAQPGQARASAPSRHDWHIAPSELALVSVSAKGRRAHRLEAFATHPDLTFAAFRTVFDRLGAVERRDGSGSDTRGDRAGDSPVVTVSQQALLRRLLVAPPADTAPRTWGSVVVEPRSALERWTPRVGGGPVPAGWWDDVAFVRALAHAPHPVGALVQRWNWLELQVNARRLHGLVLWAWLEQGVIPQVPAFTSFRLPTLERVVRVGGMDPRWAKDLLQHADRDVRTATIQHLATACRADYWATCPIEPGASILPPGHPPAPPPRTSQGAVTMGHLRPTPLPPWWTTPEGAAGLPLAPALWLDDAPQPTPRIR